jgi:hypothetical protein
MTHDTAGNWTSKHRFRLDRISVRSRREWRSAIFASGLGLSTQKSDASRHERDIAVALQELSDGSRQRNSYHAF